MTIDALERIRPLSVTAVSDGMSGLNGMISSIRPLDPSYRLCGRAVTVSLPPGDNMMLLKAMESGSPGDVLVVDAGGCLSRSFAGDFVVSLARIMGFSGIVADGVVRDSGTIRESGYPVFCLGTTVACSKKIGGGAVNVAVSCGGAAVKPGDLVVGDRDGVVVVPWEEVDAVAAAAISKTEMDERRAEKYLANRDAAMEYLRSVCPA